MKLPIHFDYRNTGLTENDFGLGEATDALGALRDRVDAGEIGFPHLGDDRGTAAAIAEFARDLRRSTDTVFVVGIGGSALGAYALDVALRGPHPVQVDKRGKPARPRLVVLDNVEPGVLEAALRSADPKRTTVCVIAKSGSTAETLAAFLIVREWMTRKLGRKARARIVAVTDAHKGDLLAIAKEERYPLFFVPANVGGRFSVFTPVGLVPAALCGLDIGKLLRGVRDATAVAWGQDVAKNPALASALVHYVLDTKQKKTIEVVFAYSSYLWGAAFWYRQLWAESLGKRRDREGREVFAGQTPVAALGVTDQHSQLQLYIEGPRDKMITFWAVERRRAELKIPRAFPQYDSTGYLGGKKLGDLYDAELTATEAALTEAGRPNCRWTLERLDEYTLGAFFQLLEFQTAFAGELYGVDAFDQPGVELGKKLTYGLMGRKGYEEFARRLRK